MAQKTNLNVSPYFDDFDSSKNYYRVLFNPGKPVQTRELNTLQSFLQDQIEKFGSNIFKEGSVVIPGNTVYDGNYYSVKLNPLNFGVDISLYLSKLLGKKVIGQTTGITATVDYFLLPNSIDIEYPTIFVKYIDSDLNNQFNPFTDGEELYCTENIVYGNTTINSGTTVVNLIDSDATGTGSAVSIDNGVYFIRGTFVNVNKETIVLDPYNSNPSYRIGLKVSENIITSKDDSSLYDNAKGFTNYAAPGADRLQIVAKLSKKSIDDLNDIDFVELLRVKNGQILKVENKTQYNIIRDYLAQRTYDESGDYVVNPFKISVHNSLNDRLGNDGLFFDNEKTEQRNDPSDDLLCVKMSPGKAYVRGYDIEKISTTILDVDKPRDTQSVNNIGVSFEMGNLLRVNNVSGVPVQKEKISLKSGRIGDTSSITIGEAKVYNFSLTDASYSSASTSWDLYLFDIQTYTLIELNKSVNDNEMPISSFVKGNSSGASGYAIDNNLVSSASEFIYLRQTSGTFSVGEQITINGTQQITRTIKSITVYSSNDIKSIFQEASALGLTADFSADSILYQQSVQGFSGSDIISISPISSGVSTVSGSGKLFTDIKVGSIIRYSRPGFSTATYNKVASVSADGLTMNLTGVSTVSGVCDGGMSTSTTITPFAIVSPSLRNEKDGYLFSILPNNNISSANLTNSTLTFTAQTLSYTNTIPGTGTITVPISSFNLPTGLSTAIFQSFDAERYTLSYSDGVIETLTSDKFSISNNQITLTGLTPSKVVNSIYGTFVKTGIQSKVKILNRSRTLNVNLSKYSRSGTGNTSINDGLTYNRFYGLRVQDEEISLNRPDAVEVIAVYESLDTSDPVLDQITFSALSNIEQNAIVGENIIGSDSKSIARVVTKSGNSITIVYLSTNRFISGETITFRESNIVTPIVSITPGNYKDLTNSYQLDKGQKNQYYDYSRIVRNQGSAEPSKRLLVVFDHYEIPSSDNGDAFSVLSYDEERYGNDIPSIGFPQVRATDTIDYRPYLPVFSDTTKSPFDFDSRDFSSTLKVIPTPDETSIIGYSFYLPRIDKVYLNKLGEFYVEKGISSLNPKEPTLADDVMEMATIFLPPYLYSPRDITISLRDNRRYTMRDIGKIENRVSNLEKVTSLSLLELNTSTLQIQDANNLNRFRTGFFVDDFRDSSRINTELSYAEVNDNTLTPVISRNTLSNQLVPSEVLSSQTLDLSTNFDLLDSNVQKTGNAVTLKYESIGWIEQALATVVSNVNPFHVVIYQGSISLTPESDSWVRTIQLADRTIYVTDTRTDVVETESTEQVTIAANNQFLRSQGFETKKGRRRERRRLQAMSPVVTSDQTLSTSNSAEVSSSVVTQVQSTQPDQYMRSRNTEFVASNLRPGERYYQFLDGNSGVHFIPKLLEIATDSTLSTYGASGSFTVGETVIGSFNGKNIISFRVAKSNHKSGSFSSPTATYTRNPYVPNESIPSEYSQSSKILNIDTFSLSQEAQGLYSGYLVKGALLVGQTSGVIAYVKDLKLISDEYGSLIGSFFLEDPNTTPAPAVRIETGTKTFKLSSSSTNESNLPGSAKISFGETNYISQGTIEYLENVITQTTVQVTTLTVNNTTTETSFVDPLAQSFVVGGNIEAPSPTNQYDDKNGAFLTAVDVFFASKDSGSAPVTCEIRTVDFGTPTRRVLGEPVTIDPSQITTSTDASVPTKFTFPYPIYLAPGQQYAVVLLAPASDQYEVWVAAMGQNTVNASVGEATYTKQFAMGRLYKSQNGAEWTPSDNEDMKFKLYKANFTSTTGTVFFQNPPLDESNGYVELLENNPLETIPREVKVGITPSTSADLFVELYNGRKIGEGATSYVYGYLSGTGAPVSTVTRTNNGENYVTDSSVNTYNITGNGSGLVLNITASNGALSNATIVSAGSGYMDGDVVGIVTSTVSSNTGTGARITVSTAANSIDTLYLTNFTGENFDDSGTSNLVLYDESNNRISLGSTFITSSTPVGGVFTGNFIRIFHLDHGMYSNTNKITISNAVGNFAPIQLTTPLTVSSSSINVSSASTANFGTFEGMSVSASNPGYLKIDNEIIKYESVSNGGLISGLTRGVDNTTTVPHQSGSLIYKYELNGISLRRINTTHDISDTGLDIDSYFLEIDRTTSGVDRSIDRDNLDGVLPNSPMINFDNYGSFGENSVTASKNIMYTSIIPAYEHMTPGTATGISAQIRTVSGTSVSGNETSFLDQGYESVQLNRPNDLLTPRLICSRANEANYLSAMPRNKSLVTALTLSSNDPSLSPLVFTNNCFSEFRLARFNNPITNYADDGRVNSLVDDPNAAYYISNTIQLEQPSTSLRVILSAYRDSTSDIRVLYNLIRPDSSEVDQSFELFPGYDNLTIDNNADGYLDVVDPAKNSGLSDVNVPPSSLGQFREYQYTAYDIGPFTGFTIKVIMSGTNQALYPRIKDLRVLALA